MRQHRMSAERWDRGKARETLERFQTVRRRGFHGYYYERLRDEVVVAHLGLVRFLASKFANRGEPMDDLVQVGLLGLVKAIDRFDMDRGVEFVTYAAPTITGEIKRYFRDKGWALKVPRRLQELHQSIARAIEELTIEIGRVPTPADLARRLHATEEEILEAQDVARAYRVVSLDVALPESPSGRPRPLEQYVGATDSRLAHFEDAAHLQEALGTLTRHERTIVYWRYYESLPQVEIAKRLNVSQMHVSRVQNKALQKMRRVLLA